MFSKLATAGCCALLLSTNAYSNSVSTSQKVLKSFDSGPKQVIHSTSSNQEDFTPLVPSSNWVFNLGHSMDGILALPTINRCIETSPEMLKVRSTNLNERKLTFELIQSQQELQSKLSSTRSADINGSYGIVSGNAKYNDELIRETTQVDSHTAILIDYKTRYLQEDSSFINFSQLAPNFRNTLQDEGAGKFRSLCGDGYISYLAYGTLAKFTVQLSTNTLTSSEIKTKTASLSIDVGNYGNGKLTYQQKQELLSKYQGHTFSVEGYTIGIDSVITGATNIQGVFDLIDSFNNNDSSVHYPIEYQIAPYSFSNHHTLDYRPMVPKIAQWLNVNDEITERCEIFKGVNSSHYIQHADRILNNPVDIFNSCRNAIYLTREKTASCLNSNAWSECVAPDTASCSNSLGENCTSILDGNLIPKWTGGLKQQYTSYRFKSSRGHHRTTYTCLNHPSNSIIDINKGMRSDGILHGFKYQIISARHLREHDKFRMVNGGTCVSHDYYIKGKSKTPFVKAYEYLYSLSPVKDPIVTW